MTELDLGIVFFWSLLGTITGCARGYRDWRILICAFSPALAGGVLRNAVLGLGAAAWVIDQRLMIAMLIGLFSGLLLSRVAHPFQRWLQPLDVAVIIFVTVLYTHRAANGYWSVLEAGSGEWLPKHFDVIPSLFAGMATSLGGGVCGEIILKASSALFEPDGTFGPNRTPLLEPCLLAGVMVWLTSTQALWVSLTAGTLAAIFAYGVCRYFGINNARLFGLPSVSQGQAVYVPNVEPVVSEYVN
jgi:uncharacterized membrane protein YeiH